MRTMNRGAPTCERLDGGVVRLSYPLPDRPWSVNERLHWAVRSKLTAVWRGEAANIGRRLKVGRMGQRVSVQLELPFARRSSKRDPMNFYPPVKATIDGLTDAGLWPDDTAEYVQVIEPLVVIEKDRRLHRVVVWLRPIAPLG